MDCHPFPRDSIGHANRPSRNLDIHKRRVLLAAVAVAVAHIALEVGARDRGLDRIGEVAPEELHLGFRQVVAARNRRAVEEVDFKTFIAPSRITFSYPKMGEEG